MTRASNTVTLALALPLAVVLSHSPAPVAIGVDTIPVDQSVARGSAVDFNRDIQPIFSDTCYHCHGPDKSKRVSDFRLDTKQGAFDPEVKAIVPNDIAGSDLIRRITSSDPEMKMPPPESERSLTPAQIELLKRWVSQGAKWQEHWAFVAPKPFAEQAASIPKTKNRDWRENPIDDFVLAQLEARKWSPAAKADRETLIRRVTLDLIGLPPTIAEVDQFLADPTSDAYEKVVDRLLNSPRYGERMASMWLDAARYADTSGYQNDGPRQMWRYRDWVIEAFNENMPFDEFTKLQLAGDLMLEKDAKAGAKFPRPTDYQSAWRGELFADPRQLHYLIPSAFNRNHRGNAEGGIIPEEYQVEYVVDRVDTTATVWLGLTLGCCRCHDHKYDPVQQKEFYQFYAFFNNVPEFGRAVKEGNSPPFIKAPTREDLKKLAALRWNLDRLQDESEKLLGSIRFKKEMTNWLIGVKHNPRSLSDDPIVSDGLIAHFRLDQNLQDERRPDAKAKWIPNPSKETERQSAKPPEVVWTEGRQRRALKLDGSAHVDCGDFADFSYFDPFSLSAWVRPTEEGGAIISRMTPGPERDGYYLVVEDGRVQFNLVKRWLDDSIRIESLDALPVNQWTHVAAIYDGSREARGMTLAFNGKPAIVKVTQDFINQTFAAKEQPVRIGGGVRNFHGQLDDVRIYDRALTPRELEWLADSRTIAEIVQSDAAPTSTKLRQYFIQHHLPGPVQELLRTVKQSRTDLNELLSSIPTLMVMQELQTPRTAHVLLRGEYDKPGAPVEPGVPAALPSFPEDAPRNRLGLAQWLVSPENPLTARVIVNRMWQQHFGVGLVKTTEDFGIQGEHPTHPQLLDYLAAQLIADHWDLKAMHRQMVTSATYRQVSKSTAEQREADPENRWFGRGPRFRLPAEVVRDQALAVGGLLKHRLGGPSVFPYQPEGLWKDIATDTDYKQSHGDDLYRRSLYTYWKRTVAPPTMVTLDATSREACTVKRSRTNTPLQALALMNEVTFFEAARGLAQRALTNRRIHQKDSRLEFMFRAATARKPTAAELQVLSAATDDWLKLYEADTKAAAKLSTAGEHPVPERIQLYELAAYTMVANLLLNLDEVLNLE